MFAGPRGLRSYRTEEIFRRDLRETIAFAQKCCPIAPSRKIARSINEAARDKTRAIAKTEACLVSCRERKKIRMLFAHLKRILRLDRLRQRGPNGAKDEFLLAATAQNLRKLGSSYRSRRPYSPHEAEGLGFAPPVTTSGAHRRLQSPAYFNDPSMQPSALRRYR
jgi:hypothetical protein